MRAVSPRASKSRGATRRATPSPAVQSRASLRELAKLRREIDDVDRAVLKELAKRARIAERIAEVKGRSQIPVLQAKRRAELMRDRIARARRLGLNPGLIVRLFELIQEDSIAVQRKALKKMEVKARMKAQTKTKTRSGQTAKRRSKA
jgi:chorismate mutase